MKVYILIKQMKIIKMMPAEARRLWERYNITPFEITRLTQIFNLDKINNTNNINKRYKHVVEQERSQNWPYTKKSHAYWLARKTFMQKFFMLDDWVKDLFKSTLVNFKEGDGDKINTLLENN